jgi:hypothetical protein
MTKENEIPIQTTGIHPSIIKLFEEYKNTPTKIIALPEGAHMTAENFCYWLQGLLEVGNPTSLNEEQVKQIKEHLALVFNKVTSYPYSPSWVDPLQIPLCQPYNIPKQIPPDMICHTGIDINGNYADGYKPGPAFLYNNSTPEYYDGLPGLTKEAYESMAKERINYDKPVVSC